MLSSMMTAEVMFAAEATVAGTTNELLWFLLIMSSYVGFEVILALGGERAVRALEWPYECLNVGHYLDWETLRGTEGGRLLQSKGKILWGTSVEELRVGHDRMKGWRRRQRPERRQVKHI
jgi:hypothetical protein